MDEEHDELLERARQVESRLNRVLKFLHAYRSGHALTFVDPRTGQLVTTNYEARALADACLEGPALPSEEDTPTIP